MSDDSSDLIALDRSSVRTVDADGHLHVSTANLSKATVSPYYGREIPRWRELKLDPNKLYKLLRHPDELKKSAASFAGKPVLISHKAIEAGSHPHGDVAGAIGTDVTYEHPYLKAPLSIWPGEAIGLVKSGDQAQLSCGYRYDAEMTPGTFEGEPYDGVMRNIVGNHVALVKKGRAGPDCVIGDSMENLRMNKPLTRKAAMVLGAVTGHFAPRFALDKAIDFTPIVADLTAQNFAARKTGLSASLLKAVDGRLAMDADAEGLAKLLDALSGTAPGTAPIEAKDVDPVDPAAPPATEAPALDDPADGDGDDAGDDMINKAKAFLSDKLSPEDMAHFEALMAAIAGGGEEDDGGETPPVGDSEDTETAIPPAGANEPGDNEDDEMKFKPAMDAAVAAASKATEERVIKRMNGIADAKEFVRPWIGEVKIAHDSAESLLRAAAKAIGVPDADTVHASALKALISLMPKPGEAPRVAAGGFARDSRPNTRDAEADFRKTFGAGPAPRHV